MNYADLGQAYAEMLTVCQPFYALPPTTVSPGESSQAPKPFVLHPRLEDGLSAKPRVALNRFENPQDAAACGMVHAAPDPSLDQSQNGTSPHRQAQLSAHQGQRQGFDSCNPNEQAYLRPNRLS